MAKRTAKKKKKPEKHDNLEYFLGFGWYQIYHFVTQNMKIIAQMINMSFMVLAGMFPKLECDPTPESGFTRNQTMAMDEKQKCQLYLNDSCANFSMTIQFNSIASEVTSRLLAGFCSAWGRYYQWRIARARAGGL